jgi:hypothetical protein
VNEPDGRVNEPDGRVNEPEGRANEPAARLGKVMPAAFKQVATAGSSKTPAPPPRPARAPDAAAPDATADEVALGAGLAALLELLVLGLDPAPQAARTATAVRTVATMAAFRVDRDMWTTFLRRARGRIIDRSPTWP